MLEFLSKETQQPKLMGEIAEGVDLPVATCGRLLQTLAECGYVEPLDKRKGFILGPMSYALTGQSPYRKDMLHAAEAGMTKLAKELRENVVMAILHRGRRFTLFEVEGGHEIQIRPDVVEKDDVYETATGRIMLSWLPSRVLDAVIEQNGLPGECWPEADAREKMTTAMAQIKADGHVILLKRSHVVHIAYPVRQRGRVVAAIGVHMPKHRFEGDHKEAVLDGLHDLTADVSAALS